jgi:erythromycin 3''-O-methyltransferase
MTGQTFSEGGGGASSEAQLTEQRVRKMYKTLEQISGEAELNLLGIGNGYLNYGYWEPGCTDHDQACVALAERLGDAAGIEAGDRVLDVGFGYGEQDIHWARTRKPKQIIGVNITPGQVEKARARVEELGLSDQVDLRVGSAVSLPFEDNSFDRVVALESSSHFNTRQAFLKEALRVLRPGGVIATTDPLPRAGARLNIALRIDEIRRKRIIPDANWYPRSVYAERLAEAGFVNVDVQDITDRTIVPHAEFTRGHCTRLLDDPRFKSFQSRNTIKYYRKQVDARITARDYVLTRAEKPGTPR